MKKNIILALAAVMGLTSCESFLDQLPETSRTADNFYKTQSDFYNALIGGYQSLKLNGVYGSGSGALMTLSEIVSDNTTYTQPRTAVLSSTFEIDDLIFTKSNTVIQAAWVDHYIAIGRLNPIIQKLPGATFPQADRDRFDAEARFLRALLYFDLVRLFGDVQLITEPVDGPYATSNVQRAPKAEVYQLIIDDLTLAGNRLPATIGANEAGRASKWAAKALLAKVYLTQGNYAQALPLLQELNTSSGRSLMASFPAVFANTTTFVNNTEVIFAVQYKSGLLAQGSAAPGAGGGVGVTQGSDIWSTWAPFGSGFMLGTTNNGGNGNGFNTPTPDLINAFETGDTRKNATLLTTYPINSTTMAPGAYSVKFRQQGAVVGDADVDFPVLRFGDVVLMLAETLNELGQTTDALVQLNRIRTRAALPARTGLTQAAARLAIEQERRVELAFENQRWPDLVRTNRFVDVMRAKGFTNVQQYQQLYPVPQRETDLNSNLSQNPGY